MANGIYWYEASFFGNQRGAPVTISFNNDAAIKERALLRISTYQNLCMLDTVTIDEYPYVGMPSEVHGFLDALYGSLGRGNAPAEVAKAFVTFPMDVIKAVPVGVEMKPLWATMAANMLRDAELFTETPANRKLLKAVADAIACGRVPVEYARAPDCFFDRTGNFAAEVAFACARGDGCSALRALMLLRGEQATVSDATRLLNAIRGLK